MTVNRNPLYRWLVALLAALAVALGMGGTAAADMEPLFQFPQSNVAIRTGSGRMVHFRLWVADNPSRREQGLMFLRDLDEHGGMVFVYPASQPVTMWMKNTYISLDMLFIDNQGRIDYIAPRATPLSLDIIEAPRPVSAVIELKGGAARRLGIQVGDSIVPEAGRAGH